MGRVTLRGISNTNEVVRRDHDLSTLAVTAGRAERVPWRPTQRPSRAGLLLSRRFRAELRPRRQSHLGSIRGGDWRARGRLRSRVQLGHGSDLGDPRSPSARPHTSSWRARRIQRCAKMLAEREAAGTPRATFADVTDVEADDRAPSRRRHALAGLDHQSLAGRDGARRPGESRAPGRSAGRRRRDPRHPGPATAPLTWAPISSFTAPRKRSEATRICSWALPSPEQEAAAGRLMDARTMFGAVPGTLEAWLALRGLRTLPLRIERAQATASLLAAEMAARDDLKWIRYPGLAGDPSHATAERLLNGPGTMISFETRRRDGAGGGDLRARRGDHACGEPRWGRDPDRASRALALRQGHATEPACASASAASTRMTCGETSSARSTLRSRASEHLSCTA